MTYNSKNRVYGHGTKGREITRENGEVTKPYKTWSDMLRRCYAPKYQKLKPTYIGCSVCVEWLYFPNFKKWFDTHYVEGFQLDKDILITGNKIYSPDTCIFVPQSINKLFTDSGKTRGNYPIGVSFNKQSGKFVTYVTIDGKLHYLGLFDNAEEAHKAYLIAKKANVLRMAEKWKGRISDKLLTALIRKADEQYNNNNNTKEQG